MIKLPEIVKPAKVNGSARIKAYRNSASGDYVPSSVSKRKKVNHQTVPAPEPSTRELRSRSKNNFDSSLTSISSRVSIVACQSDSFCYSSVKQADDSGRDSMTFDGPLFVAARPPAPAKSRHILQVKVSNSLLLVQPFSFFTAGWRDGP